MSIRAITWASETDLLGSTRWVLMALANYANDEEGTCWPGQAKIAAFAGVSERTVREQLVKLEEAGYIQRAERRRQDGTRSSDFYRLLFGRATAGGSRRSNQPADSVASTGGSRRAKGTTFPEPSEEPSAPAPLVDVPEEPRKAKSRRAAAHALPADWKPSEAHAEQAAEANVDVLLEARKFRDHAEANDRRQVSWDAAFRMWLTRAAEFAAARPPGGRPPGQDVDPAKGADAWMYPERRTTYADYAPEATS